MEHVYYDVSISGEKNNIKRMEFNENRVSPILPGKSSDYELNIDRLQIPLGTAPAHIYQQGSMKLRLRCNATTVTKDLVLIPGLVPIPGEPQLLNYIFNYQDFVRMCNKTLSDAYDDLILLEPTCLVTEKPFVTYNAENRLFSILNELNGNSPVDGLELLFNLEMANAFSDMSYFVEDFENYRVQFLTVVVDGEPNLFTVGGKVMIKNTQPFPSLFKLSPIKSLVVRTNIPLRDELISTQNNLTENVLIKIPYDEPISNDRVFQYFPKERVYKDLITSEDLRRISLQVYIELESGKEEPLFLYEGQQFNIKILFRLKE